MKLNPQLEKILDYSAGFYAQPVVAKYARWCLFIAVGEVLALIAGFSPVTWVVAAPIALFGVFGLVANWAAKEKLKEQTKPVV